MNDRARAAGDPVSRVVACALGLAPDAVDEHSSPDTLTAWDSLGHLAIILALESEFGVQLPTEDAVSLRSVAVIRDYLESHGVAAQ
jgi:acyl carrier protein